MVNWKILIICFALVFGIGFFGSFFNTSSDWYDSVKPSITPPSFVFPIVWNILFFMIALSLYFVWIGSRKKQRWKIGVIFGLNLFFNFLWSLLFFGLQKPVWAFFDLIFIWLTIWGMIFITWKIDRKSSLLLIPYLVWVSFAVVLNLLIAF